MLYKEVPKKMNKKGIFKTNLYILIIALILIPLSGCSPKSETSTTEKEEVKDASYYGIIETYLTTEEKLGDFQYMYTILEENYPFFEVNKRLNGVDWLGNKEEYERRIIDTKNDVEFFEVLKDILRDLNNWHTNLFYGNDYEEYYKNYSDYYSVLSNKRAIKRYNLKESYNVSKDLKANDSSKESAVETDILIEDKVAYIKLKSMSIDKSFHDRLKMLDFLPEINNYEKLIIDIRGNTGGFDDFWMTLVSGLTDKPLVSNYLSFYRGEYRDLFSGYKVDGSKRIEELDEKILEKLPPEIKTNFDYYNTHKISIEPLDPSNFYYLDYHSINFKGDIYLLVDKSVFSSAEVFASFCKDAGFATLIGEPTGGDRVFEIIPLIALPNSGLVVRFSCEMGINQDGTINMETKTVPDIVVDPTPHKNFRKDKCIKAAIKDKRH